MVHYSFALLAAALLSASAAQAQGLCFVQAPQSYNCADGNISRMDAVTSALNAGNGALAGQRLDQLYPGENGLYQVQPNATLIGIAVGQTQYAYVNASGIAPALPADADQLGAMFRTAFADLDTGVQQTAVVFALQQLLLGAQTEDSFAASGMDVAMVCANSVVNATGYQGGAVEGAFTGAFAKAKAAGVSQNTLNARIKALAAVPSAPTLCTQTVAVAMTAASNAFDALHAGEEPAAPACKPAAPAPPSKLLSALFASAPAPAPSMASSQAVTSQSAPIVNAMTRMEQTA